MGHQAFTEIYRVPFGQWNSEIYLFGVLCKKGHYRLLKECEDYRSPAPDAVGFPGLDMIHINSHPMLGRSSAGHAPAAVILLCPVLKLAPFVGVQECLARRMRQAPGIAPPEAKPADEVEHSYPP